MKKKHIGGYFEWESLPSTQASNNIDSENIFLRSGRSSLAYILQALKIKHIHVPYLVCNVIIELLDELHINYDYYKLNNQLEIDQTFSISDHVLYINYFGLKDAYCHQIAQKYKDKIVIDHTHQIQFQKNYPYTWSFNSLRKHIGVPDGSILYPPTHKVIPNLPSVATSDQINCGHLIERFENRVQEGYELYKSNENTMGLPIRAMSNLTKRMMAAVNLATIASKRLSNFNTLHDYLKSTNMFPLDLDAIDSVPFTYPYLPKNDVKHQDLWNQRIYAQQLWPASSYNNPLDQFSCHIAYNTLHLPIDHRYNEEDMCSIINTIRDL